MLHRAGFILLVLAFAQVPAQCDEYVPTDFIENVLEDSNDRILSGWEAHLGQHPHQVSLRMVSPEGAVSACGGSVVHRNWVLTAAHCTAGRITLVVRAGLVNLTRPEYIFEAWEWYNHPTYNDLLPGLVQPNDIAIVKLQRPVTYTRALQSIRLQTSAEAFLNYDNEVVYTSGYGRTWSDGPVSEVLNWVYLRAVSNPTCALTFGSIITDNTVCARFFNVTSQSTCHGDSGGPLVHVNSDGVPILIGVTSFVAGGSFGCHSGLPAGFIRTGPFLGWLEQVTGIDFENLIEEDDVTETPEPEISTTTTSKPEISTTTTPKPEISTTQTPEPEIPTTETPEPEILTTATPETEISTTTTAKPEISTTTTPKPETSTTQTPEPEIPTTQTPESEITTTTPEPDTEEEEDDSESEEDPELSELLKKISVKVKVKVKLNKYINKKIVKIIQKS